MGFDNTWEKIHSEKIWGRYPNERAVAFIMRYFGEKSCLSNINILDLGCGGGANLFFLAKEGFSAYGIDGSASALANAENWLSSNGLDAKLTHQDMTDLSCYEDALFDAVIDVRAMSNVPYSQIDVVLKEVFRVLKVGGKLLTIVYGSTSSGYCDSKQIEPHTFSDIENGYFAGVGHITVFHPSDIMRLLSRNQFKVSSFLRVVEESLDVSVRYEEFVITATKRTST